MLEIKELIEDLGRTFETFKVENDLRIKEIEAKGHADPLLAEKVEKINAEVGKIAEMKRQLEALDKVAGRGGFGGGGSEQNQAKVEYAQAFNKWMRKGVDAGLKDLEIRAELSTLSDPDGGFLVPDAVPAATKTVAQAVSVMRELASVVTIGIPEYKILVDKLGESAEWVSEKQARLETSTPTLAEVSIVPKEMSAEPKVTQTMLDDASFDVEGWVGRFIGRAFAALEGAAFITGNGVEKPKGIAAYEMVVNSSYVWGKVGFVTSGNANLLNNTDKLIDLQHALKTNYRNGAVWLMNDSTLSTIRKFKDGEGNYIFQPGLVLNVPDTLLGKPVKYDDYVADIGAGNFPVFYGEFKEAYLIVDRMGIRMLRDPYTSRPYINFYTTSRVGAGLVNYEAIKCLKIAA
ncbi:MAG: phage major capsid protein [Spirochaetales bacterium]|jgi:HK97 family phage major capsid protein|nr:phage major capsid protein [Spirochaetales bacterium]